MRKKLRAPVTVSSAAFPSSEALSHIDAQEMEALMFNHNKPDPVYHSSSKLSELLQQRKDREGKATKVAKKRKRIARNQKKNKITTTTETKISAASKTSTFPIPAIAQSQTQPQPQPQPQPQTQSQTQPQPQPQPQPQTQSQTQPQPQTQTQSQTQTITVYAQNLDVVLGEMNQDENLSPIAKNPHIYFVKLAPSTPPKHGVLELTHLYSLFMGTNCGIYWSVRNENADVKVEKETEEMIHFKRELTQIDRQAVYSEDGENDVEIAEEQCAKYVACFLRHNFYALAYYHTFSEKLPEYQYGKPKSEKSHALGEMDDRRSEFNALIGQFVRVNISQGYLSRGSRSQASRTMYTLVL